MSKPSAVAGLARVRRIACGDNHSLCVTERGRLYTFGHGKHGQLGHGDRADSWSPMPVRALCDVPIVQVDWRFATALIRRMIEADDDNPFLPSRLREEEGWEWLIQSPYQRRENATRGVQPSSVSSAMATPNRTNSFLAW